MNAWRATSFRICFSKYNTFIPYSPVLTGVIIAIAEEESDWTNDSFHEIYFIFLMIVFHLAISKNQLKKVKKNKKMIFFNEKMSKLVKIELKSERLIFSL